MEAGSIYELNKNGIHCSKYYNIKDNLKISKNKNFDDIVEEATSTLKNNLLFLNDENINTHCDITGGVDTRVIIALMHNQNIDFTTGSQLINQYEDFSNYGKYSEKNIINKIEKLLNLKTNITDENDYNDSKELIDEITFYLSNKQTYNRRTSHFLNIKNNNFNINISGLSGTELLRSSYYQHFKGNNELGLNDLLKEYVGLVDILKDNVFDKKSYYPHLNKYYSKNLKDLDYEKPKDLSSFIDYFAFYRTHFTRYHGLANSIVPFYTPYGDFNFAKLMYETSYDLKSKFKLQRKILENINPNLADLNCTRGFPLTTVKVSNFWRFKNMINKDIPQQYFTPMQKFKDNISYNFIKFSLKNKNIYNLMFKNRIAENPSNKKNIWGNPNDLSIINYSSTFLNSDLPIFSIIDKEKLEKYIIKDCNYNVLNRVVNLNEIIEYCN